MTKDELLHRLFGDDPNALDYDGDDGTCWGPASGDQEDEDEEDFDDFEDDEGTIPLAPGAPDLVLLVDDPEFTVDAALEQLGDLLLSLPDLSGPYWDGKAVTQSGKAGEHALVFMELHTTDPDEMPAPAYAALLAVEGGLALVVLGEPHTQDSVISQEPSARLPTLLELAGAAKLPALGPEQTWWFM